MRTTKIKFNWKRNRPFTNIFILALKVDPRPNTGLMVEALKELPVWNYIFWSSSSADKGFKWKSVYSQPTQKSLFIKHTSLLLQEFRGYFCYILAGYKIPMVWSNFDSKLSSPVACLDTYDIYQEMLVKAWNMLPAKIQKRRKLLKCIKVYVLIMITT